MKNTLLLTLATLCLATSHVEAQTVVPFSTQAAGKSLPINWGMDTAWDDLYNVQWGIAHYGANFTTGRISFQPYELVDATKIDDAGANFGLPLKMARKLQQRIDHIKLTGTTNVAINCDHEALTRDMNDETGELYTAKTNSDGVAIPNVTGRNNYLGKPEEWYNLIKATTKYAQAQGLTVVSVSPFNESDFGWDQYTACTSTTYDTRKKEYTFTTPSDNVQNNTGIPAFKAIAKLIKEDSFFDGIRVCGGNTLNCDRASAWYEGLKPYIDEGNTHQLSGSFANYANFFATVRNDGKVGTADELHNVGEAMVGAEYGMTNGIWWAFDAKARGQFMHDSNEGVRLGYAEDRSHWTSAAVYRNDKDGEIHGFIGSSERQANVSTYNFQCQDREVYFNGYGPQKEWSVTTVGGAANSYQKGQINYEYLFDITYGEDVQSAPVDGNYQIMSAADMKLLTFTNGADVTATVQANNTTQRWHIYPDNEKKAGDCSYWYIDLQSDANAHLNLRNGNLAAGATLLTYNANHDALEQFYFRYAKDGYFYIITRQSNKYMYNNNGSISVQEGPTSKTGANELKKYMWRLMPTNATAEQTAPSTPTGLAEGAVTSASANFSWSAVSEANVTYNVLRQDANGWNTIARLQSGTTYTDTKVEAGKGYRYKVQAVDYSGNRSEMSETIMIMVPEAQGGETPTFTAGQWEWVGETAAAGSFYIYNKANKVWLKKTSAVDATPANATLFTISGTANATISYSDNGTKYVYESGGNQSWGTTYTNTWTIQSQTGGYYISHTDPGYSGWFGATRTRYIEMSSTGLNYPYQNFNNNNRLLQFISENQISKYAKVSDYNSAFSTAKGYLSSDLSSELMTELTSTIDACDGTINYNNIETYITNLNTVIDKCKAYVDEHPAEPDNRTDFTGLIINPSIIQNGTTNDAPTGWKGATTNVTGNGHWTEGTGDTRLEAWNWSTNENGLNANYYQDIIVPNGLYTLTAVTHQRANGDAALYAETYELRETSTTMPVGDGNEAETSVQNILVTDGTLRIGIKATNDYTGVDNQWMTADNFTLTRVSTPEDTDLSHYTDAIAYLDGLAEAELVRNTDHTELLAARKAAHYCEADANAYEKAINDYVAAIKRAKAMTDAEPVLSGSWIGQTGNYSEAAERYNWDTPYPAGRILYQVVEDLIPGGEYEIQFYATANVARNLDAGLYSGSGIAYIFANNTEQDIDVIYQADCTPTNYPRTLKALADENGQIAYGIANRKEGGQWYVAQSKSITYLGKPYTATLSVKPGKYGTFVAPFDVELPAGITAYSAENKETSVVLTQIAESGETLTAYTPVILKNTTDAPVSETYSRNNVTLTKAKVVSGPLVGVLIAGDDVPAGDYVMQTQNEVQAFYIVVKEHPFTSTQNRCYLTSTSGSSSVKAFQITFDGETGVEAPEATANGQQTTVYDLSGRKVADKAHSKGLKRGLYIVGGKKVMVQ